MSFSHDTERALQIVVDLVNTAPEFSGTESLSDVATLRRFVATHHISGVGALGPVDLTEVRRVRSEFGGLFGLSDFDLAAKRVNSFLAGSRVEPRLTDHDDYGLHMHYFSPGAGLAEHLAVDGGMALAQVVAEGAIDRLRMCEASGCNAAMVDLSRNQSKRYCDARTCGNRTHVAAYRERKRQAQPAGAG